MGYLVEYPDVAEALRTVDTFSYALMYQYSDMLLCPVEKLTEKDWEECLEARIFREDAEMHFWLDGEKKVIRILDDGSDDDSMKANYILTHQARRFLPEDKKSIVVKRYLEADEDGQVSIVLTRLSEIR